MRKKLVWAVLAILLVACMAVLPGCKAEPVDTGVEESEYSAEAGCRRTVLYYASDDGYMVPVMKRIPWEEGIGKAALSCLVNSEQNVAAAAAMGLRGVISEGTQLTLRINEGLAIVDLQELGGFETALGEQQMVTGIVNTLCEFPTVDAVKILIDGEAGVKLEHGTAMPDAASSYALNVQDAEVSVSTGSAYAMTVYFPNQSASLNIPVTEQLAYRPEFEDAVQRMIDGKEGLLGFPAGTSLLGASVEDGTAMVDLGVEFLAVEDTEGLALALYDALFLTACEFDDVSALKLRVNGKAYEVDSAPVSAPLYINEFK